MALASEKFSHTRPCIHPDAPPCSPLARKGNSAADLSLRPEVQFRHTCYTGLFTCIFSHLLGPLFIPVVAGDLTSPCLLSASRGYKAVVAMVQEVVVHIHN